MANSFQKYYKNSQNKLGKKLVEAIERGLKYSANEYTEAKDFMEQSYRSYSEVFEDYYGVITPASTGVADKGLKFTGSPEFCTVWTYMGLPTISLPLLTGGNNLPLGVQLVGDKLDDLRFLSTANWLEKIVRMMNKIATIIGCGLAMAFFIGLATTLTRSMMIGFKDVLPVYILMGLVIVMMLYEAFFDKNNNSFFPYLFTSYSTYFYGKQSGNC